MSNSIYSDKLSQYYELRCGVKRFDNYLNAHIRSTGQITERFINAWVGTLNGKSGSVENEVITIRQFLKYLTLSGEPAFIPIIPKVCDDYVPYIFSDNELEQVQLLTLSRCALRGGY